jgi:hypothetical protein
MTTREKNMANLKIGTSGTGKKLFIKLGDKLYPLAKDWKRIFAFNIDKEEWDPTWLLSTRNLMAYQQDLLRSQTIKSGKVRVISSNPAAAEAAVKVVDQILNS